MSAALALTGQQQAVAAWRAGVVSLPTKKIPCPGMIWTEPGRNGRSGVWAAVHQLMLVFLDEWGERAADLGWSTTDLFGVHRTAGAMRVDSTGALVTLYPFRVLEMTANEIRLGRKDSRQTYRGQTNPTESVPLWDFAGARNVR